jgi:hypothetical protein
MIGAGMVWRLRYVGVRCTSALLVGRDGGVDGRRSGLEIEPVGEMRPDDVDGLSPENEVGEETRTDVGEETRGASLFASRARSSHFPRTVSRLFVTLWEGVQRRVDAGVADEPVGWDSMLIPPDWELLRERRPPPLREEVRSRRRVW